MSEIAANWPSTAAKIRALDAAGYNRREIATFVGKSYQHVYNTLNYPLSGEQRTGAASASGMAGKGLAESDRPDPIAAPPVAGVTDADVDGPQIYRFEVAADGSITLPPQALRGLDAVPGRLVTARFEEGELKLMSIEAAVRFVQKMAEPFIKEGEGNWSDQLIEERRAEAAREAERDRQ